MVAPYRPSAGVNVPQMLLTSSGYGAAPGLFTCMHGPPPQAAFAGQESDDVPSFTERRMSIWRVVPSSSVHLPTLGMVRPASGFTGYRYGGAMETVCHPCPVIPFDRVEVETIGAQGELPVLGGHRGRLKIMHVDVRRIQPAA